MGSSWTLIQTPCLEPGHLPLFIIIPQGSVSVDFGSQFAECLDFGALVLFMSPFRAASDSGATVRAHLVSL